MSWMVCTKKGKWIGIIETNYSYAIAYWPKDRFTLKPYQWRKS